MEQIRPAAVAGAFYPGEGKILSQEIDRLIASARQTSHADVDGRVPKALVAPHAGYRYSGPIAASAYSHLASGRGWIQRVVLLGPAHRVPVRGLALPDAAGFATPLGVIPVDREAIAAISGLPQVTVNATAHAWEHSLEVQLPFLQEVLGVFTLVPLVVGDATAEEVAEVLECLWNGSETLLVVSSDLSHYLPYDAARNEDHATAEAILNLSGPLSHEQACGGAPLNGLLLAARRRHLHPKLLDLRNSGDTAGDHANVVGYGAFAFFEETAHVH